MRGETGGWFRFRARVLQTGQGPGCRHGRAVPNACAKREYAPTSHHYTYRAWQAKAALFGASPRRTEVEEEVGSRNSLLTTFELPQVLPARHTYRTRAS